ncbi:FAD-binding and (Fe-S)-binding domain-containing protein [Psychromonas sp. 14N.309.X.WAT.B.A12]|uniref:FAD-binding and (Fe-S)-binding domain-containing protein n=1 Tax=Psychromonas sp. 14N.309.X.WAT.B.A12 TaxID=2998322 RepID=UPI0025B0C5EB|nr:FAD-binding and (Fe-S)-binding domain-containing protein [Psychromonas sp. 14N.309.X.WAT.B.A12]MDN2664200.1 FAD-binding and (Fe-S)-binding domain-containing protein [Psychromonas sp. 14N.309.X.WAT.B.A12]
MLASNVKQFEQLEETLLACIDKARIFTEPAQLLAYGTDASFYRLVPKVVVRLHNANEVIYTLRSCAALNISCTFRAAGTSLSGQAVSDSVLITLSDQWRGHEILEQGHKITLQPGVIGADANKYLLPYGRKIGPDPASINTCKIGGIAANNASGMCCGVAQNSYRTVDSMQLIFADGTQLNTADNNSVSRFKMSHPSLINDLKDLCEQVKNDSALSKLIKHKYRLKNTTGYSLNALVDYQDPIDVIQHLMIGSEGTLGFIKEITYNTVIEHRYKASALIVFNDIETACQVVSVLAKLPVSAVEMMDGRAMHSIADKPGMAAFIKQLDLEVGTLLIESRASDLESLNQQCAAVMEAISNYTVKESIEFTRDPSVVESLWAIRKGLFPAVGAVREVGTTVIIEDVAFPVQHLAAGVRDLQALFDQFDYHEAIIFGHALDGNLHFVFTQSFETESEIVRYSDFMDALTQLVAIKHKGSLKAEHGTGRNMAPYVELEWGKAGYALMQKIKAIFDPNGLLNPGVIINESSQAHIENLKPMPAADDLIDRCIECGFCEPVCPSRTLTLSPRQRIVLYREMKRSEQSGDSAYSKSLADTFQYQGIDTCAATGLCADRCPVGINTGDLVKKLRSLKYQQFAPIARWTANHFSTTNKLLNVGLKVNQVAQKTFGSARLNKASKGIANLSNNGVQRWSAEVPGANTFKLKSTFNKLHGQQNDKKVVYLASCSSRSMGQQADNKDQRSLTEVTSSLLAKAGFDVIIPDNINDLCCGQPHDSKGFFDIAKQKSAQLETALWEASEHGKWPVLMDTSPCAKRSIEAFSEETVQQMQVVEPSLFVLNYLVEYLNITPLQEPIMLHITCSTRKMALDKQMLQLAQQCASEVIVPEHIECCGWAGDKGFTTPELNSAALSPLRSQIPNGCTRGYSNSRTCEIGLSHHSGIAYQSILYLVDEVSS